MTQITDIHAREVFDSRGKPTVEVDVVCDDRFLGRAIVPSGASTGQFEALELRDGGERLRGSGVRKAVENINGEVRRHLLGWDACDQQAIDQSLCELDGTENKSRLGANATLGVSLATAYASAQALSISPVERFAAIWNCVSHEQTATGSATRTPKLGQNFILPMPMVNMISGGLHAGRNLDIQDVLILPMGAKSYREALEWIISVYWQLGRDLTDAAYEGVLVGDEGGFGPKLQSNEEALQFVVGAIEHCQLEPGRDVAIGLDVASTHFYEDGGYRLAATGGEVLSAAAMTEMLAEWVDRYPIISIEDGLADDDWDGWNLLTKQLSDRVQLIGDDLFVTNQSRLREGISRGTANSVLVKVNQIGTLWETLQTMRCALDADYWPVVSARSGETEDATISDLSVATGAGQIKVGSVARSERLAKYNQLLRLEEQLGDRAAYLGGAIFSALAPTAE